MTIFVWTTERGIGKGEICERYSRGWLLISPTTFCNAGINKLPVRWRKYLEHNGKYVKIIFHLVVQMYIWFNN